MLLALVGCSLLPKLGAEPTGTVPLPPDPTTASTEDDTTSWTDSGTWTWSDSGTWTGSGSGTSSASWTTDSGPSGSSGAVSVSDVQEGRVAELTEVEVDGVVVTAVATYGFYVQDPAGGEWSGIWVYGGAGWDAVWPVAAGDQVSLGGQYQEFFGLTELNLVDAASPWVVAHGAGPEVVPATVALADLGPAVAEPWESVLVRVEGLELVTPDAGNGEFAVGDGSGAVLTVDDQVHAWSEFGVWPAGATVRSVTGVLDYAGGEYQVEPRSDDDIDAAAVTPYELQQGAVVVGTEVELYGLVVTAVDEDGLWVQDQGGGQYSGVWVYLGAGWDAVWGSVVAGDRVDLRGVAGEYYDLTEVDVTTAADPLVVVQAAGVPPAPEVVAVADATEAWEGVLIEVDDVLVADPDLGFGEWLVTPIGGGGLYTLVVDDQLHAWSGFTGLAVADKFDAVVGPLSYAFGVYQIEPRSEADVVPR